MKRGITHDVRRAMVISVLVLGVLGSCGQAKQGENQSENEGRAVVTPQAPADTPSQPAPDTAMTDVNIEGIVITVDLIAIQDARLAQSTSNNDAVKAFAAQMIADHASVNAKVNEVASRIGMTARANDVSRQLTSDADAKRSTLRGLTDGAFDNAYIKNEIDYQQAVIDLLDSTLIPRARNVDLKGLLQSVRPSLVEHLNHANKVQASLAR
jgi:putative membrane protein